MVGCLPVIKVAGAAAEQGKSLDECLAIAERMERNMATLAVAFALPYTHQVGAHIGVEVLVQLLSQRTQVMIELCTQIASLILFAIVTWQMALYADTIHQSKTVSMSLQLPEYLIIYVVAVCFLLFSLTIIKDVLANVKKLRGTR